MNIEFWTVTVWDGMELVGEQWFDDLKQARKYRTKAWREVKRERGENGRAILSPGLRIRGAQVEAEVRVEETYRNNKRTYITQTCKMSRLPRIESGTTSADGVVFAAKTTKSNGMMFQLLSKGR